ncbi:hypothetical protein BKE38_09710 [Pseudoroseomonas deserti]|uniref:Uncharacterized protein n=1 Tax=Teichococcus deserti TaxID=1817963 RepID=A0A1V2H442_9PROT|nr:hypothetical protein [Pseudoroseomonas deserti]ONG54992.1 hypothetical protein BKE38_09710 [Pseudoroseomonas deserti]
MSSSISGLSSSQLANSQVERLAALQLGPRNSRANPDSDQGQAVDATNQTQVIGLRTAALGDDMLAALLTGEAGDASTQSSTGASTSLTSSAEGVSREAVTALEDQGDSTARLLSQLGDWRLSDAPASGAAPGGVDAPSGPFGNRPAPPPGGAAPEADAAATNEVATGAQGSLEPTGSDAADSYAARRQQITDSLYAAVAAYATGSSATMGSLASVEV